MVAIIWRTKTDIMITPFEDLLSEAEAIQEFLEEETPSEISLVLMRGNELLAYIARTGKMKADARYWKEAKTKSAIMETVRQLGKDLMPASTLNKLIEANCEKEVMLLEWCDRLNRTATHQVDWLRSVVSKEKEELRLSQGFNQRQ
jgi:hypothetical protein